jgi:alpha-tubulin suppressor-like RCC1 family protein
MHAKTKLRGLRGLIYLTIALCVCHPALAQDVNVVAWGNNTQGQTNVPPSATNVIAVAAGWYHSLALSADGTLLAWGAITNVPDGASNIVAIAAGASNNLALTADGSVLSWGDNAWGQTNLPVFYTNVVAVAAGNFHNLALMADGTVVAWGKNLYGQASVPPGLSNVVAISAGAEHSLALKDDGSVVVWGGSNVYPLRSAIDGVPFDSLNVSALSAGSTFNLYLSPSGTVSECGTYTARPPSFPTNIVAVAAGTNFSLALDTTGLLIGWGQAMAFPPAPLTNIVSMAVGLSHALAVRGDGSPHLLGSPAYGKVASFGATLPLSARAVGQSPLSYQWLANAVPVPNATNATPLVPAAIGTAPTIYQVVVSNPVACVTSSVASVVVSSVNSWGGNSYGQSRIPASVLNPVSIAAGSSHLLALQADGTLVAWGKDWDGQTDIPAGAMNIVMIAAGGAHNLALKSDGTLLAWGRNRDGQVSVPPAATNIVAMGAGAAHSVVLRADGTVVAWGNNDYGQCSVSFLADQVIAIAAGFYHTLALRVDGVVVSWGAQSDVPLAATNVTAIAAGWGHSLALRSDGSILAWGDNTFGQCTIPAAATNIVAISAGWYHSMALRGDGSVVVWGKGVNGVTNLPSGLSGVGNIDAGEDFCTALAQAGTPRLLQAVPDLTASVGGQLFFNPIVSGAASASYQWTHNGLLLQDATNGYLLRTNIQASDTGSYELTISNQTGQFTTQVAVFEVVPAPNSSVVGAWGGGMNSSDSSVAAGIDNPIAIAAGDYHNLVLKGDGTVLAFGDNMFNQTNLPPDLTNAVAVAAGYYFNLALRADRTVVAWGRNIDGETNVPAAATNVIAIAARQNHALALRADGTVVAWGDNTYNQTNVPAGLNGVIGIAVGYSHNLALRSDHTVVSWGAECLTPASATNVVAIAVGLDHSLALKADGTIMAWGDNAYGQCSVPGVATNAVAIAAGWRHSLALLADGHVIAWGQNYGASNFPGYAAYFVTNLPPGLKDVAQIACGTDHDAALVTHGAPYFEVQIPVSAPHTGESPVLVARGGGSQPLTYQWYRDSAPLPGATNRWLQLGNIQSTDSGDYTLVASNAAGQVSSTPVTIGVHPEPSLLSSFPLQQNWLLGAPATFSVNAVGAQPLSYQPSLGAQALQDGGRITGSSTPNISINPIRSEDNAALSVVVTNDFGAVTGLVANVVVTPIVAWGDNSSGQCFIPTAASNAVSIVCGLDHSLAICSDGRVVGWGDNSWGQINVPDAANGAIAVAAGDTHSLALKPDGTVVAWGGNLASLTNVPATVQNVTSIAAGSSSSLALLASGVVVQWGVGTNVQIVASNCLAIAAGGGQSLALGTDGTVVGSGAYPPPAGNYVAIAAGTAHGLALRADGQVVAWGDNTHGQTNVPASAHNVIAITARGDNSLAVRSDGTLIAWGDDFSGQNEVPAAAGNLKGVALGGSHCLAQLGAGPDVATIKYSAATVMLGNSSSLAGTTVSGTPTWYQWRFNGMNLVGATNPVLPVGNFNWTNAGTYTLISSNAFGVQENKTVTLSATRLPLQFDWSTIQFGASDGSFQCRIVGAAGVGKLVVFASTNLHDWAPVFTNPPVVGPLFFTNYAAGPDAPAFFRAAEIPDSLGIWVNLATPDPSLGSGGWLVRVDGLTASGPVVVAASTNLVDWTPIFTNPPTIGPMRFLAPPSTNGPQQFYRAYEQR